MVHKLRCHVRSSFLHNGIGTHVSKISQNLMEFCGQCEKFMEKLNGNFFFFLRCKYSIVTTQPGLIRYLTPPI